MAVIIITRGKTSGRRIAINTWPVTLGRDANCGVTLDDERVSRQHARIKKRDRLFVLEDLQSRNGTYLNGDRVLNATIQNGDRIIAGDTEILFLTPEAQIDITTEFLDFDHNEGNDLGIAEVIELNDESVPKKSNIRRLSLVKDLASTKVPPKMVRFIFEQHGNILESTSLDDACAKILKTLHTLMKNCDRSAFFLWNPSLRKLVPTNTRFSGKRRAFSLSKRAFEDAINRRQGIILAPNTKGVTQSERNRLVLPVEVNGEVLGMVYAEIDALSEAWSNDDVALFQIYLERCAPSLENFILRRDLDSYLVGMIEMMIATLEAKDTYTLGHSERVSRYSLAIADELQLNKEIKKSLLMSSICHDIGKVGIPDAILRKAALLNPDEYEEMKQHPTIGANIVSHLPNAKKILSGVKYHHEKWDGSGYPDGLKGEEIPFFGRIVAVADVFDAMISGRTYSGFIDSTEAVESLSSEVELFDPDILKAFTRAYEKGILTQRTSTKQNKDGDNKKSSDQEPSTTDQE